MTDISSLNLTHYQNIQKSQMKCKIKTYLYNVHTLKQLSKLTGKYIKVDLKLT